MTDANTILILEQIRSHYDGSCKEALDAAISAVKQYDGMTNGEVMKAMFPYIEVSTYGVVTSVKGLDCNKGALDPYRHFWSEWWNAPYKVESEE